MEREVEDEVTVQRICRAEFAIAHGVRSIGKVDLASADRSEVFFKAFISDSQELIGSNSGKAIEEEIS